ncbi:MAG: hypothetical protein RLO12_19585, partial [Fulvivirga sp.]
QSGNQYVDLLYSSLIGKIDLTIGSNHFFNRENFDIVHIQWPEDLLQWYSPEKRIIQNIGDLLYELKENSKVAYTLHNETPHIKNTLIKSLYNLILDLSDGIVHLGKYSIDKYSKLYPNKYHVEIPHGIYQYPNEISRNLSRKYLGLNERDKVVLIFGTIRSYREQEFIWRTSKNLREVDDFVFLVSNLHNSEMPSAFRNPFKRLKAEFIHRLIRESKSIHIYNKENITDDKIQYFFKACDIVLIPRIDSLNSGVAFLGFSFARPVIGPDIGNIGGLLKKMDNPIFTKGSGKEAAEKIIDIMPNSKELGGGNFEKAHSMFSWSIISNEHVNFYSKLLSL